jgi:hypothetical protein
MKTPLYSFLERYYPTPGTGNYAFSPNTTLPELNIQGAGRLTLTQYEVMAGRQQMSFPTLAHAGLGGLFAGQYVSQALLAGNENG